jgi:hypothetical protein
MLGCKGALHKVTTDDLCRLPDGSQAQARIPTEEKTKISREPFIAPGGHSNDAGLGKGIFYLSHRLIGHG